MTADNVTALIIGNEVLSAKVVDANGAHLLRRCREAGVSVAGVHFVPDDVDAIVEMVLLARQRSRFVITSGGVGPTHDDVTVRAVSLALGREVVVMEALADQMRSAHKGMLSAHVLRLAEAPKGSRLVPCQAAGFPVVCCDGVYMLPGIPSYFRSHLEEVLGELPKQLVALKSLYVSLHEADFAEVLEKVANDFPHVRIGSYPAVDRHVDHRVKLTVEHEDVTCVDSVMKRLREVLPQDGVIREEH